MSLLSLENHLIRCSQSACKLLEYDFLQATCASRMWLASRAAEPLLYSSSCRQSLNKLQTNYELTIPLIITRLSSAVYVTKFVTHIIQGDLIVG
jgi:hypothetical protein